MKTRFSPLLLAGATVALVAVSGCAAQPPPLTPVRNVAENGTVPAADPTSAASSGKRAVPPADQDGSTKIITPAGPGATSDPPADPGGSSTPSTSVGSSDESTGQLTAMTIPKLGPVVADAKGRTLYRYDKDMAKPSKSRCNASCEKMWSPVIIVVAISRLKLHGVDVRLIGTLRRSDGRLQLTINGWPMYRYARDNRAGQWGGQGKDGAWWAARPNGGRNAMRMNGNGHKAPVYTGNGNGAGNGNGNGKNNGGGAAPHHW